MGPRLRGGDQDFQTFAISSVPAKTSLLTAHSLLAAVRDGACFDFFASGTPPGA